MAWCEENQVDYLFGLARNARLEEAIRPELAQAKALSDQLQQPVRLFTDVRYRTHKSWSRQRRVVAKAEVLPRGPNPRFVVTSLSAHNHPAQPLYEQTYCARGEMENRIKEQQLEERAFFGQRRGRRGWYEQESVHPRRCSKNGLD